MDESLEKYINSENSMTIEEINEKSVELINEIIIEKQNTLTISPFELPASYYRLCDAERALMYKYPGFVVRVFNSSNTATYAAKRYFIGDELHNGNGDAFRHAYWNVIMSANF